jgi:glycosyltransferase involved in cell wall biosynthesis
MRICVLGDYSGNLDEGFKIVAFNLTKGLLEHHTVIGLDLKKIFFMHFWRDIKDFDPQIIHYLTGPSTKSFVILKVLALYLKDVKRIASALHSSSLSKGFFSKKLMSLLKPDLILTQSHESEEMFNAIDCRTKFLANGVDTDRFVPVSKEVKEALREKYGIEKEKFVVLHVGHIIKVRNLRIFNKIQGGKNQVIIVASTHRRINQKIYGELKERGCIVLRGHLKNIEEIYALSDCYIFPVIKSYSLFTPLSVLEAMSCNLPVISAKFEGLTSIFGEGNGLLFARNEDDFINKLEEIKRGDIEIKTREVVLSYSWQNIVKQLENIYNEVLHGFT